MSVDAFQLASEGNYDNSKEEWERTRIIAYNSIAPHLKKDTTLKSFMPFVWDKELKEIDHNRKEKFRGLTADKLNIGA